MKPEDFSLGDLSMNLCAQCRKPRVKQERIKPWQDTLVHKKFGRKKPPTERQVHEAFKQRLRQEGKSEEEVKQELEKWHKEQAA